MAQGAGGGGGERGNRTASSMASDRVAVASLKTFFMISGTRRMCITTGAIVSSGMRVHSRAGHKAAGTIHVNHVWGVVVRRRAAAARGGTRKHACMHA